MKVEVKKVVKRYEQLLALDHVSLEIMNNEIYGVLGGNGSGKSTLFHCLLNIYRVDKGEILYYLGDNVVSIEDIKSQIGVVMKEITVFHKLTVYDNLLYFISLYTTNKLEVKVKVNEVLTLLELDTVAKLYPNKLSDGQLARLNFACGIIHGPKLLFLDEPVYHIDTLSKNLILDVIRQLNKNGTTIIYFTQNIEEIEELCHRISVLKRGRVVATGSIDELKNMISISEVITIETYNLEEIHRKEIEKFISIADIKYEKNQLIIKSKKGTNNLLLLLDYMKKNEINFGKVYTQIPDLSDVIMEITGERL